MYLINVMWLCSNFQSFVIRSPIRIIWTRLRGLTVLQFMLLFKRVVYAGLLIGCICWFANRKILCSQYTSFYHTSMLNLINILYFHNSAFTPNIWTPSLLTILIPKPGQVHYLLLEVAKNCWMSGQQGRPSQMFYGIWSESILFAWFLFVNTIKGSIFLKNRHFFIQWKFNELL